MKKTVATVLLLVMVVCVLSACITTEKKSTGVMTYSEYVSAKVGDAVTIETYIQGANSWWDGKITLYTQDKEGAYFIYDMPCSEADAAKLIPGTKIKVTGTKSKWKGEVEIIDATFEIENGSYIAKPKDVTAQLGKKELIDSINQLVSFKGLKIEASTDAEGNTAPYLYKSDGSGKDGDDVYFNVSKDGNTYTFLVRSYLTGLDTEVYKTAKTLKIGDVIDCEGFLYWYDEIPDDKIPGVNPHITGITVR